MLRVLSWNLYHGRDFPPDPALFTWRSRLLRTTELGATHAQVNRELFDEFAGLIDAFPWDVALLQEAPPRWFRGLGLRTRSNGTLARTSRNCLPPAQRLLARHNPDLIASWEGGSNQLLVRAPGRIRERRRLVLAREPERRTMQWARLELPWGELCVANLHASAGLPDQASRELVRAAEQSVEWSAGAPLVLGGDLNLRPGRDGEAFDEIERRFGLRGITAPNAIDHLLARGLETVDAPRRLRAEERELPGPAGRRLRLSDHAPVTATFA